MSETLATLQPVFFPGISLWDPVVAAYLGRAMYSPVYHSNPCPMPLTYIVFLTPVQPEFRTSSILLHSGKCIQRPAKYCIIVLSS